ncbi:hypothetical protein PALA4_01731 [Pseudomonas aeruginosa]|nr:hypothetical protein PALA4_01731 [Pseudomonas aeruginosa]
MAVEMPGNLRNNQMEPLALAHITCVKHCIQTRAFLTFTRSLHLDKLIINSICKYNKITVRVTRVKVRQKTCRDQINSDSSSNSDTFHH